MKTWIIPLIMAGMFAGCAHLRPRPAEEDSATARAAIREVWQATKIYYYDKGAWPNTVDDLIQNHYLAIAPAVSEQWHFWLVIGPPLEIRAYSTERVDPERREHPRTVTYDVLRGQWKGYGVPEYGKQRLTLQQRTELASGARQAIEDIARMAQWYYTNKGEWPETVELLEQERYIEVDVGVAATWQFAIIGSPPQAIVAVSKKDMPDGAGRAIEFDIVSGIWRGYGLP